MDANVGGLDRLVREEVQHVSFVLLDSHSERFLELEIEAVRFLDEFDATIWSVFLHALNQVTCLL